jgi:alkanesulfonate monooxygenase SsuD/methylene tetrahydromethanopterin reductase-like flavin-dependent oxidoreductase (luciferase family)
MEIGIGLPATIPGVTGEELTEWARRADRTPLASLGTIDRIVYGNYEPLVALAAAAAVTDRIKLLTSVLLMPLRLNTALFAKQAATVHHLSGGRLVLGMGIGGREDDFDVSGASLQTRGRVFDRQLDEMKRIWAGEEKGLAGPVGPNLDEPPQLVIGGNVDASFERAAKYGAGWIMGGGTPDQFREGLAKLEVAWSEAGRQGTPRKMALSYYSLGSDAERNADAYLRDYYAFLGEDIAGMIAGSAAKDADTVRQYAAAFEQSGADELIFFPSSSDPEQVDLLVEAAGL